MSGFWLVSYLILWLLVLAGGLALLALAHEMENLRNKHKTLQAYLQGKQGEEEEKSNE